jgi:hypothetical protein
MGFEDDYLIKEFETAKGIIEVLAEIKIEGDVLHLEVAIYPQEGEKLEVGIREILKIRREFTREAREAGFRELHIKGLRRSGAKPGKQSDLWIKLR